MPIASTAILTIYDAEWQNPRTIAASGVVVDRAVNQPETLSALVTIDDVARLGRVDLIGAWCFWEHPTQEPFGGIVDDDPSDLGNGAIAITATDIGRALLLDRSTPVLIQPDTGHAGALARRAMTLAQTADPLPFRSVACDESGPVVEVEWRGDQVADVLDDLARQTEQEWRTTVDRERNLDFVFRERIGEDKTDRVLIAEGYHVAGGRADHSRLSVTNDITGIGTNKDFERSAWARIEDEASRARYGRRQSVRRYDRAVSALAVKARVRSDIRREATAPHLPTITIPALHPVALEIRLGDTIRYWSRSRNRELDFRVMTTTVRDGELTLAGIAEEVRVPPVVPPFTPDLLSGLVAWYDAADLGTLTIGSGVVIEWRDKSSFGSVLRSDVFNASRYDPTRRMVVMGASGFLSGAMTTGGGTGMTIFAVATPADGFADRLVSYPDATFTVVDLEVALGVNGSAQPYGENWESLAKTGDFQGTSAMTVAGPPQLLTMTVDRSLASNEVTIWQNGVSSGTRPVNGSSTGGFNTSASMLLSSSWDVGELVIYGQVLGSTQRQAVEGALRRKWGVA